jgi:hypothetical protein
VSRFWWDFAKYKSTPMPPSKGSLVVKDKNKKKKRLSGYVRSGQLSTSAAFREFHIFFNGGQSPFVVHALCSHLISAAYFHRLPVVKKNTPLGAVVTQRSKLYAVLLFANW